MIELKRRGDETALPLLRLGKKELTASTFPGLSARALALVKRIGPRAARGVERVYVISHESWARGEKAEGREPVASQCLSRSRLALC